MLRSAKLCLRALLIAGLAGCASDYSPDTYSGAAVQQANKVEPGVVVGFRQVSISANGAVGAVTGGAAGGILGAQVGPGGFNSALGTVGGSAIGSILGSTVERFTGDTTGWEYIVRKPNGELLSLTQREPKPLPVGQKVLVITGSQARIVPDYSAAPAESSKQEAAKEDPAKAASAPAPSVPAPAQPAAPVALTPQAAVQGGASQNPTPAPVPSQPLQQTPAQPTPAQPTPAQPAPAPSAATGSADAGSPFQMTPSPAPVEPQHGPV